MFENRLNKRQENAKLVKILVSRWENWQRRSWHSWTFWLHKVDLWESTVSVFIPFQHPFSSGCFDFFFSSTFNSKQMFKGALTSKGQDTAPLLVQSSFFKMNYREAILKVLWLYRLLTIYYSLLNQKIWCITLHFAFSLSMKAAIPVCSSSQAYGALWYVQLQRAAEKETCHRRGAVWTWQAKDATLHLFCDWWRPWMPWFLSFKVSLVLSVNVKQNKKLSFLKHNKLNYAAVWFGDEQFLNFKETWFLLGFFRTFFWYSSTFIHTVTVLGNGFCLINLIYV